MLAAEEYARIVSLDALAADAEAKAQQILAAAEAEREAERKRGYAEGLAEGRAETAERMLALVSRSVDYLASAERDVARIVMICLRRVLSELPEEEIVIQAARAAIGNVRGEPRATLRVRPEIAEGVRSRVGEILSGTEDVGFLEVSADPQLEAGGCRLETDIGMVDASLEVQLAALEAAMASRVGATQD